MPRLCAHITRQGLHTLDPPDTPDHHSPTGNWPSVSGFTTVTQLAPSYATRTTLRLLSGSAVRPYRRVKDGSPRKYFLITCCLHGGGQPYVTTRCRGDSAALMPLILMRTSVLDSWTRGVFLRNAVTQKTYPRYTNLAVSISPVSNLMSISNGDYKKLPFAIRECAALISIIPCTYTFHNHQSSLYTCQTYMPIILPSPK